jgi:hypothetical protein
MKPRTCPVCGGERVIIILGDGRKGLCSECGSQWVETIAGERTIVSVPGQSLRGTGAPAG